ncbi:MAG TPA: DUF932 domain-containing protein [Streptosporangiaceae bacterium]|nr:DUF932 domain-containing protein [Streptosporangiaceae bacterium]
MLTRTASPQRNLPPGQLASLLKDHSARALDVIAGSGAIRAHGGHLILDGTEPALRPDGVTMTTGSYAVSDVADGQLADKLGIPLPYLRRMHADAINLYDANVNGWLARTDRRFLIRVLRGGNGTGVVRAVLSDKYSRIDHLDVLMAALDGIRDSGVPVVIDGADLSERRMSVRVHSPDVQAMAPQLLAGYRSPFDGRPGTELPVVWGGFLISNSETGFGAFTIAPRLHVQVCSNGLVMTASALRRTHLGSRHDDSDGVVTWSEATTTKTLELITSRTRDAVAAYLDPGYVTRMIRDLETVSGKPVTDPDTTISIIAGKLRFTEDHQRSILAHFAAGGAMSAGGILHAITSVAQTLDDADAAHDLEAAAIPAMHLAASL